MKATHMLKIGAALVGITLLACATYWIAFYTIAPSFDVTATREANGSYRFDISPNFIVRSVSGVSIVGPNGTIAERREQVAGAQALFVASGLASNDTVTIKCHLQYDRVVPSTTEKTQSLVVR